MGGGVGLSRSAMPSGKGLGPGAVGSLTLSPSSPATPGGPAGPGSPTGPCTPSRPVGPMGPFSPCGSGDRSHGLSRPAARLDTDPGPHSPGHPSLLLLRGDPGVLGARGGQWVPRIPLHRVPQGSPKRGNGVRPPRRRPQPTHQRTPHGSQENSPKSDAYGWPCSPCQTAAQVQMPPLTLPRPPLPGPPAAQGPQTHRRTGGTGRTFISLQTGSTLRTRDSERQMRDGQWDTTGPGPGDTQGEGWGRAQREGRGGFWAVSGVTLTAVPGRPRSPGKPLSPAGPSFPGAPGGPGSP